MLNSPTRHGLSSTDSLSRPTGSPACQRRSTSAFSDASIAPQIVAFGVAVPRVVVPNGEAQARVERHRGVEVAHREDRCRASHGDSLTR